MRSVVIGAGGFIGRNLIAERPAAAYSLHGPSILDITCKSQVEHVLRREAPDVVINCATYGNFRYQTDGNQIWNTSVEGTRNILDALRQTDTLYIHLGSYSEYGVVSRPMQEEHPCNPVSHYGRAKLAASQLCRTYWQLHGVKTVVLRISSAYGQFEQSERLFPTLFRRHKSGDPFELWNGDVRRDFTNVRDITDVIWQFAHNNAYGRFGEIFNVSRGKQLSIREVVETFCDVVGPLHIVDLARKPEYTDSPVWEGDIRKLQRTLDSFRFMDVRQGLQLMKR